VASRAEAAAATASGRLEKVLLEHGEHTMRVAGLEQAHTQVPLPHSAYPQAATHTFSLPCTSSHHPDHITLIRWQALVDRTAAERERRVLQHVTSEAVARLNDLTHASAAQVPPHTVLLPHASPSLLTHASLLCPGQPIS